MTIQEGQTLTITTQGGASIEITLQDGVLRTRTSGGSNLTNKSGY